MCAGALREKLNVVPNGEASRWPTTAIASPAGQARLDWLACVIIGREGPVGALVLVVLVVVVVVLVVVVPVVCVPVCVCTAAMVMLAETVVVLSSASELLTLTW